MRSLIGLEEMWLTVMMAVVLFVRRCRKTDWSRRDDRGRRKRIEQRRHFDWDQKIEQGRSPD